jgi:hypothetical protein
MKSIGNHLYNRNGYFYFRLKTPASICELILMNEIVIALGTRDVLKARLYSAQLNYELQNLFLKTSREEPTLDFGKELESIKISIGLQSSRKPNYMSRQGHAIIQQSKGAHILHYEH